MRAITAGDILGNDAFKAARPALERAVVDAKVARRLAVGPRMTLLFENRATVLWQIQEMCRVEHITDPKAVAHEIETYNALLPTSDTLSATLLIEVSDPNERLQLCRALVGFDREVFLNLPGGLRRPAVFDDAQFNAERVSTVHYLKFPLAADGANALADLRHPASLVIHHDAYRVDVPLPPLLRGALIEDLAGA